MKKTIVGQVASINELGCYGEFQIENPLCKKYCVLNIRCAIEQEQNARMEILEELVASEDLSTWTQ
ncbi:MAG: hypothetical protein HKM93_14725 [Desulfobacteraceae bacterium]|nr:hypothetical protein [Desulfobacteraceae bacterium]